MITNIHGAPHCSSVVVGSVKKFVSSVWTEEQDQVAFDSWMFPQTVSIVEATAGVTLTPSQDTEGRDYVSAEFTSKGTVLFLIEVGTVKSYLNIEVTD